MPYNALRALLVLLLLGAGFPIIQLPTISAQVEPDPILAAEQALFFDEGPDAASPLGPTTGVIIRMVLTLALAAAAIYGVVFFIKKSARRVEANDPFLKVLASAHLGSNRHAHVVAVGSKAWLLGASEGGVSLIGEIDDKDVLNAMFLEDSQKNIEAPSGRFLDFKTMLRRLGTPLGADTADTGADSIRKRRERLKGL